MAVSFKVILSTFVVLIVVITALVAFLPTYFVGANSIDSTVENVRQGIVRRAETTVADFYATTRMDGLDVMQATKNGVMDFAEVMSRVTIEEMTNYLFRRIRAAQNRFAVAQVRTVDTLGHDVDLRSFMGAGTLSLQYIRNRTFHFEVRQDNGWENDTTPVPGGTFPPTPLWPGYQSWKDEVNPAFSGTPLWSATSFNYDSPGVNFAVPIYASNGTINGLYWTITVPTALQNFVSDIGLRSSGRAMAVDARDNGTVLAVSWGEAVVTLDDGWSPARPRGSTKVMEDLTDPLMKRVLSTYGRSTILTGATPMQLTMGDSEKDEAFVDIIAVQDTYGLNNRIVIAMPLDDFLGDFYSRRDLVAGILVAVVVVLAAAAVGFAIAMTRPLESLGEKMKLTATLQDSGEDEKASMVKEIAEMQVAYQDMKLELTRVKSFLPQSIMQASEQPTSNKAVVQMDNSHGEGSMTELNPFMSSKNSEVTTTTDVNEFFAMRAVDTTKLALDAVNTFTAQDSVVVQITAAYSETPTASTFATLISPFLKRIINLTAKHRGIVELLRPHRIVISFGARSKVADPAAEALKLAMSLVLSERTPNTEFSVLLDRGNFFVGSCGSDKLRQEAFIGADLDVLESLGAVVHTDLRMNVAATSRIVNSLVGHCTTMPVDCVQFPDASRVQLHAVIPVNKADDVTNDSPYLKAIPVVKKAFSDMLNGDYVTAKENLCQLPHDVISTESPALLIGMDAPTQAVAEVMQRLRVRDTVRILLNACGRSSDAAYCRIHVGWPHVGPQLRPTSIVAKFDVSRATSTEDKRLKAQLDQLDKMNNKAQLSFNDSRGDKSADATSSALFDMALASASLTYSGGTNAVLTANSGASKNSTGPAQTKYLRRWQRSERLLGQGAFGAVYRALSDNGSVAAMKIVPLKKTNANVDELRKELVVSAKQRHENLVSFVESEVTEDEMVVIMELMAAGSLESLRSDFGRLNSHVVRRFATDILRGLSHLHRAGIAHCDVKPQNVLVGVDGVCKLADFGAALHRDLAGQDVDGEDGFARIRGTPMYMAPEVARGDGATPASDIWSVGILLHQIIGDQFPFNVEQMKQMLGGARSCMAMLGKLEENSTEPLRRAPKVQLPDDVDPAAASFIQRCLHLDPFSRPNCEQLLTDEFVL